MHIFSIALIIKRHIQILTPHTAPHTHPRTGVSLLPIEFIIILTLLPINTLLFPFQGLPAHAPPRLPIISYWMIIVSNNFCAAYLNQLGVI
jgi:hypothetical protein